MYILNNFNASNFINLILKTNVVSDSHSLLPGEGEVVWNVCFCNKKNFKC